MSLEEIKITENGVELVSKVDLAMERMKAFEPKDGYYLAFSGGKDSCVLKALADMAGVKYDAHYQVTSVDPPELVRFIRQQHPDVAFNVPHKPIYNEKREIIGEYEVTMWNLIPTKTIPPTRLQRYCCAELKEGFGKGRIVLTGVRWAESVRRKNDRNLVDIGGKKSGITYNSDNDEARRMVEQCYQKKRVTVNPIIDWTDDDVWEFIRKNEIPYCELYDQGCKRLGCIGCPMNTHAAEELERYPKYKAAYKRAFARMLDKCGERGVKTTNWTDADAVMDWWLKRLKNGGDESQIEIEFEEDEDE